MHLQHQLGLRADRVPHGLDERDRVQGLLVVQLEVPGAEGVDLQRLVAALHDPLRRLVVRLRGPLGRVPPVGVRLDLVGHLPAEELPHRYAQRLALDVPARHLDHRDAGHDDLTGPAVVAVLHPAHEVLDSEGVRSENVVGLGLPQIADQRVGVPEHPGLADSRDAFVGVHLDVGQVAPRRADHVRADSGDAHGSCPSGVRDFVTRSKCWRDSKDGPAGVSMGRTGNGFGKAFEKSFDSAPNLHSDAWNRNRADSSLPAS